MYDDVKLNKAMLYVSVVKKSIVFNLFQQG